MKTIITIAFLLCSIGVSAQTTISTVKPPNANRLDYGTVDYINVGHVTGFTRFGKLMKVKNKYKNGKINSLIIHVKKSQTRWINESTLMVKSTMKHSVGKSTTILGTNASEWVDDATGIKLVNFRDHKGRPIYIPAQPESIIKNTSDKVATITLAPGAEIGYEEKSDLLFQQQTDYHNIIQLRFPEGTLDLKTYLVIDTTYTVEHNVPNRCIESLVSQVTGTVVDIKIYEQYLNNKWVGVGMSVASASLWGMNNIFTGSDIIGTEQSYENLVPDRQPFYEKIYPTNPPQPAKKTKQK